MPEENSNIKFIVNLKYHKYFEKEPELKNFKDPNAYTKELSLFKNRQFYSCKEYDNVISYLTRKGAIDNLDDQTKHMIQALEKDVNFDSNEKNIMTYTEFRPGSTGLFNSHGDLSEEEIKQLKESVRNTQSTIWSGVLSFTENYGNLVCNKKEDAIKIINSSLNTLFKAQGLNPDNINYYCAFHKNTLHPHIHFVYWEKEPLKLDSKGFPKFSPFKVNLKAIDKFKSAVLSFCESLGKRMDYSQRDIIRNKFRPDNIKNLNLIRINKLISDLGNHSSQYARLTKSQRFKINEFVIEYVNSNPELKELWDSYTSQLQAVQKDINQLHQENKIKLSKSASLFSKNRVDELYSRCGNEILKLIKAVQEKQSNLTEKEIQEDYMFNIDAYFSNYWHSSKSHDWIYTNFLSKEEIKQLEEVEQLKESVNLKEIPEKKTTTESFETLLKQLKDKGWNPRTEDEIKKEYNEYVKAKMEDETYFKNKEKDKHLSPLNLFFSKNQRNCEISLSDNLEYDKQAFEEMGITFVSTKESNDLIYKISHNKKNKSHPEEFKIKTYIFNQPTKRYILINKQGKKVDYFLTLGSQNPDSLVCALRSLGLSAKDILALAIKCHNDGLAFKLITKASSIDSTLFFLNANKNNWKEQKEDKVYQRSSSKGQNPVSIYKNHKKNQNLIYFLSHLISDYSMQISKDITKVLKEFYDELDRKGDITIYGEQE